MVKVKMKGRSYDVHAEFLPSVQVLF